MKLMIVESPSKTKKISSFLGAGWVVEASFGHVLDLPKNELGVSMPDYAPAYEVTERSKKQVGKLKTLAKNAAEIWLATDPDREGEAIAAHLKQLLGRGKIVHRVTFNEITQAAVLKAISQPRTIDDDLVSAQQARRVLDRLYGYKISPALSNVLRQKGVSAGRVQTVALKLIVEREIEIRHFVPTKHFGVKLDFGTWEARWDSSHLTTEDMPYILNRQVAEQVLAAAREGIFVQELKESQQQRKPPAPLITSTLQQAAANRLNMSVNNTMAAAQKLFEEGLITYMRTDNPNLSEDGIAAAQAFLQSVGQTEHIAQPPHHWKSKDGAQEAHEAIRPTNFNLRQANTGDADADNLYQLIWRVALASCMKSAIYKVRQIKLSSTKTLFFDANEVPIPSVKPEAAIFTAQGYELIYQGWQVVAKDYTDEEENAHMIVASLDEGVVITPENLEVLAIETRAPRRYTETSLIKKLEREGIGRPATYATIIDTQIKRHYAEINKKYFQPTPLGEKVIQTLTGYFGILDTHYTAEMEEKLDEIAAGKSQYASIVGRYDGLLEDELADFLESHQMPSEKISCPSCQKGYLRCITGKKGKFWGCSEYRNGCKFIAQDDDGKPQVLF